jgi:GrpB-like predicted nucleotidyltransferase (UPF0157 family)
MAMTDAERQRKFKEKMYAAGYKQMQIWVRRNETGKRTAGMDRQGFMKKLEALTAGWSEKRQSKLFGTLIKIAEAKKEEGKNRERT